MYCYLMQGQLDKGQDPMMRLTGVSHLLAFLVE